MNGNSQNPTSSLPVLVGELDLLLNLLKSVSSGKLQQGATVAEVLLKIVQTAGTAYEDHSGQPLDPSLIRPEGM
jgi:hypothetical protein